MSDQKWTDDEIIRALKGTDAQRDAAWEHIFHRTDWRLATRNQVKALGGTSDDARDVFQETCIAFEKKIRHVEEFKVEKSLRAYFLKFAENQWYKALEQRARRQKHEIPFSDSSEKELKVPIPEVVDEAQEEERSKSLWEMIEHAIGPRCREILRLKSLNWDMEDIASQIGLNGGAAAAKKERYRCWQRWLKYLEENPSQKKRLR